jgi:hypothetical protein
MGNQQEALSKEYRAYQNANLCFLDPYMGSSMIQVDRASGHTYLLVVSTTSTSYYL